MENITFIVLYGRNNTPTQKHKIVPVFKGKNKGNFISCSREKKLLFEDEVVNT